MPKSNETVLEIDLTALAHNYHFFKKKLQTSTKFLAVVKAYAYGSDSIKIAQKLEALGVNYLAVAYVKEGVTLRKAGIKLPILVLHPVPAQLKNLIKYKLEPNIYSFKLFDSFLKEAKNEKDYPIHLKFNTGLNRLGFVKEDCEQLAKKLSLQNNLKAVSLFSHLAASEDENEREFTQNQIDQFAKIYALFEKLTNTKPIKHILNTSGILNYSNAQYNMVRSGIGLYGYGNCPKIDAQLKPVATLKTTISQLHTIAKGQTIGYNRAFAAQQNITTATLPIGHADGIGRIYGNNNSSVLINGKYAPIVGNVCMDMIMVDVTGIACNEGDEVIIFGKNYSAEIFAKKANTISYELITGISQRVKRVFIK